MSNGRGQDIDCVIIGVNCAKTLGRCIDSVKASKYSRGSVHIFYVDGGSKDGSVEVARGYGDVQVVELEQVHPTPGSGRNAGWQAGHSPLVQFLDADTALHPDWLQVATRGLSSEVGAIFGRREEMHREVSRYAKIADIEWNPTHPTGPSQEFRGDVLMRRSVLEETGGYDEEMVSGEEADLSHRVLGAGTQIFYLSQPMVEHEVGMESWEKWWSRSYRTGYGMAEVNSRCGIWKDRLQRVIARGGGALLLFFLGLFMATVSILWLALWVPAAVVLLRPRIFKVEELADRHKLSKEDAALYAWHCSLVVLPQFCGVVRHLWARLTGRRLHNVSNRLRTGGGRAVGVVLVMVSLLALTGCARPIRPCDTCGGIPSGDFELEQEVVENFVTAEQVQRLNDSIDDTYLLGPGDIISIAVYGHPELDALDMVVGPDGVIMPMLIGELNVRGKTREAVLAEIEQRLSFYYVDPIVSLMVNEYNNNKAFVLGRVADPGIVHFPGEGNLVEAISLAGGLVRFSGVTENEPGSQNVGARPQAPRKASVVRGKNMIIWVDLNDLLEKGNTSINPRIVNDDLIYVAGTESDFVYVMGEVRFPRAYPFTPDQTYLDLLNLAGGPTRDADLKHTYVIRRIAKDGKGVVVRVNLEHLIKCGDFSRDFLVKKGDVVYVGERNMAKFAYRMREIEAGLDVLDVGTDVLEKFGVTGAIRAALGTNRFGGVATDTSVNVGGG